ncbi:MAG: (2Fe-2S)-binding protein [Myxococcota bacterium]|nr:(2Fe-2S)-binding protein [Myxococcota bacterium]
MHKTITLKVNGSLETVSVPADRRLLAFLREDLQLTGVKRGCGEGECGTCVVLLDGEPVNSCLMLAVEADGREITTVEGLAPSGRLHPLQEAFIRHHGVQCGFCTPGMLLSATALLQRSPHPSDEEILTALEGNLCRCTGYTQILAAIRDVADSRTT